MATTYYYRSGERIPVVLSASACAVRTNGERETVSVPGWSSRPLTSRHLLLVRDDVVSSERALADVPALLRLVGEKEKKNEGGRVPAVATMWNRPDLVTFPVAVTQSGDGLLISTGDVVAQFPPNLSRAQIEHTAAGRNWTVVRSLHFVPGGYLFRASTSDDPFAFANDLVERHGATFAHPVFLENIPERSRPAVARAGEREVAGSSLPGPALYARQWHLANSGQRGGSIGQDIQAEGAWQITDRLTERRCLHHRFRGERGSRVFSKSGKDSSRFRLRRSRRGRVSHAVQSRDIVCGTGRCRCGQVRGVAFDCRLMPIRRSGLDNHLALAEAFAWAADHGADVISCSFGVDGQPWVLPDVVRAAFDYATTRGRRGRGIPIFFAAGNGNEPVSSDEWASSPYTIAVAASTDQGHKAPYSDFGPEISICAPSSGGVEGITTAANLGYTSQFGGTSAAAPIAAGVGALVLSLSPNLKWHEVRDVMQHAARKIDPAHGQYDPAGHSHFYGYGQVDALRTLREIPVLLEVERATDTAALDAHIRDVFGWVQRSPAGRAIAAFITARRLGILALLQSSPPFRHALGRLLRVVADMSPHLAAGTAVTLADDAWPLIEVVARSVQATREDFSSFEDSERSISTDTEEKMATNATGMEDALTRIATILGKPVSTAGAGTVGNTTYTGTSPVAIPRPPVDTIQPFPTEPREREEIARQVYHSMRVPLITPDDLLQMEAELPAVVAYLGSLANRPAARAELTATIDAIRQTSEGSERSDADQQRLTALAQVMLQDAFGGAGERYSAVGVAVGALAVAVGALGVASFSAGYTLGKDLAK